MPAKPRLYIIRHGKAFKESPTGLDRDRELQERGHRQAAWLGERLSQATPALDLILASPYARALATAERIAQATKIRLVQATALEAGRSLEGMYEVIQQHADRGCFAIVGHNMQFSELVDLLVHGVGGSTTELRTGEAAVIDLDASIRPGKSRLVEFLRLADDVE